MAFCIYMWVLGLRSASSLGLFYFILKKFSGETVFDYKIVHDLPCLRFITDRQTVMFFK